MAHFQDLSDCLYLPRSEGLGFKAVGWLERGHDYTKGEVTPEWFEKLLALQQNRWAGPLQCAGFHTCDLCRFRFSSRWPGHDFLFRNYRFSSNSNGFLFIPSDGTLFVSPSNIPHYIDAHEYCPPPEFQAAVAACPEMRSAAYFRALLATPAREWLQRLSGKMSERLLDSPGG